MFHNVNDDKDTYSISKDNFEIFLEYLCKNRHIVDAETLIREKDPNNVVISFDDVYESVFANAYPILKEKGIPYYLFICNDYLGKDGYVSFDMVKEMVDDSKAILGSHRYKHELSRFMNQKDLHQDMMSSKEELEKEFECEVDSFAFPYGSIYACSKENIEDASSIFRYVFMTYAIPYNEEYGSVLPRINMNDSVFHKEMK